jgi:hypothetical protein
MRNLASSVSDVILVTMARHMEFSIIHRDLVVKYRYCHCRTVRDAKRLVGDFATPGNESTLMNDRFHCMDDAESFPDHPSGFGLRVIEFDRPARIYENEERDIQKVLKYSALLQNRGPMAVEMCHRLRIHCGGRC